MKGKKIFTSVSGSVLSLAVAAGLISIPAYGGVTSNWQSDGTSYTGNFNDVGHWDNEHAPSDDNATTGDVANFSVNETYTVSFTQLQTSMQAMVRNGDITFDLAGGSYNLTGTGTSNSGSFVMGRYAADNAQLLIQGGTLTTQQAYIANTGTMAMTISGSAAKLDTSGQTFYVGYYGNGDLTLEAGGKAVTGAVYIGHKSGSVGSALVVGGSTWNAGSAAMTIGYTGQGTLDIENGTVTSGSGNIASYSGTGGSDAEGAVIVSGDGSTWNSGALLVGQSGSASLSIHDGGLVNTGTYSLTLGSHGALNLGASGLGGGGSITAANLNSTGGTIDVINTNIVTGNLSLDSATNLTMHLSGNADDAQLTGIGTLNFGGVLHVLLDGGYAPSAGDSYQLFSFAGANGSFTNLDLPGLASGLEWNSDDLYSDGILSVNAVPEPASFGLLALSTAGLLLKRRRKA